MATSRRTFLSQSLAAIALGSSRPVLTAQRQPAIRSDADVERIIPRISNWGRWGAQDRRGALNFITPARRVGAARLVHSGRVVSLARETSLTSTPGVQEGRHEIRRAELGTRDVVGMIPHGFALSHLDALCHAFANPRQMYNGVSTDTIGTNGAPELGIHVFGEGIVGRGVLLDVGTPRALEPGTAILVDELERAERRAGIHVGEGDILLVRTGAGPRNTRERRAGLHPECLVWLHQRRVALLGGDGDSDVSPLPGFDRWASAMHSVAIPYLGLALLDNLDLDPLARACAQEGRWQFLVTVAPWRLKGATSSLINPIATF